MLIQRSGPTAVNAAQNVCASAARALPRGGWSTGPGEDPQTPHPARFGPPARVPAANAVFLPAPPPAPLSRRRAAHRRAPVQEAPPHPPRRAPGRVAGPAAHRWAWVTSLEDLPCGTRPSGPVDTGRAVRNSVRERRAFAREKTQCLRGSIITGRRRRGVVFVQMSIGYAVGYCGSCVRQAEPLRGWGAHLCAANGTRGWPRMVSDWPARGTEPRCCTNRVRWENTSYMPFRCLNIRELPRK